ncbi:hypothetical protein HY638_01625 [Candidatus Woesearchaeota archaeon]|nr:hypothetical protein [Candidatus Woesearchaeota archaeon]
MNQEEHEFIKMIEANDNINSLDRYPQLREMWDYGRLVERDSTIKNYIMNLISRYVASFTRSPGRYLPAHLFLLVDATIINQEVRMHMAEETAKMLMRCPNWEWCVKAIYAFFELYQHLVHADNVGRRGGHATASWIASSNIIRETLKERLLKIGVPQQGIELDNLQTTLHIFYTARFGRAGPKVFNVISQPGTIRVMEQKGFGPFKKNVPVQKAITRQTRVPKTAQQIIEEQQL